MGRERCATAPARGQVRERSGLDLERELQSRPAAEFQVLRSFAPGLCIFLEVLYKRNYSSILGKFCILGPVSASHGHQMPQVGSVLSASWTSEARLLPGQGLSTDELGDSDPARCGSESGCPLINAHLGKLLDIRTREPSTRRRILQVAASPVSEPVQRVPRELTPTIPSFGFFLRRRSSLRTRLRY